MRELRQVGPRSYSRCGWLLQGQAICSRGRRGLGSLVERVEILEDLCIAQKVLADLQAAGGSPAGQVARVVRCREGTLVSGPRAGMTGVFQAKR